ATGEAIEMIGVELQRRGIVALVKGTSGLAVGSQRRRDEIPNRRYALDELILILDLYRSGRLVRHHRNCSVDRALDRGCGRDRRCRLLRRLEIVRPAPHCTSERQVIRPGWRLEQDR